MQRLRFTLLSDGSSDRALIPLLRRLLIHCRSEVALEENWADLRRLPDPPSGLSDRIATTLLYYPCDLLFVHRDAEGESVDKRRREISEATDALKGEVDTMPRVVPIVPVRMMEAWLLIDEAAIRQAAGNPNGREELSLPPVARLEDEPDPKSVLFACLKQASGLSGARRKRFRPHPKVHRIAQLMENLEPLRRLGAFRRLEVDLAEALRAL